jgi:hypothetical protein
MLAPSQRARAAMDAAAEEAPEAGAGEAPQEGGAGAAGGTYRRPVLAPKIKRLMQARAHVLLFALAPLSCAG